MSESNKDELLANKQGSLIVWMNESFQIFKDQPIKSISCLNSHVLVFKILNEM